jgi:hypothetical protein
VEVVWRLEHRTFYIGSWRAKLILALIFHVFPHGSGKSIFPTFVAYLKSKEAGDKAKNDLVKELAALDEHLQKSVSMLTYFAC